MGRLSVFMLSFNSGERLFRKGEGGGVRRKNGLEKLGWKDGL